MIDRIVKRLIIERDLAGYELSHARGLMDDVAFADIRKELTASRPELGDIADTVSLLFFFLNSPDEVLMALHALRVPHPEAAIKEYLEANNTD